ncbi:hypothetical protein TWF481_002093 [Arthrobotrys musiformis]|uniref:F-box domain-containing protein n=1 Tax=Arthrobotrys musiformis TaxID=47236 RepID=A0AAV9VU80_9PEZI
MATVESLPHDIRYIVLTMLPTWQDITSAILSSRLFYTSYYHHRRQLLKRALFDRYDPEARLIVSLTNKTNVPFTPEIWSDFRSAVSDYVDEKFDGFEVPHNEDPDTIIAVKQNHKVIVTAADKFLEGRVCPVWPYPPGNSRNPSGAYKLPPCVEGTPEPSMNEYARVVRGFYHLWIWKILYGTQYESEFHPYSFGRGKQRDTKRMYDHIAAEWGFWDTKVMEILAHWVIGWVDKVIDENDIELPSPTCHDRSPDRELGHSRRDLIGNIFRHNMKGLLESVGDVSALKTIIEGIIRRSPFPQIKTAIECNDYLFRMKHLYISKDPCPGNLCYYLTVMTRSHYHLSDEKETNDTRPHVRPLMSFAVRESERELYEEPFVTIQGRGVAVWYWILCAVADPDIILPGVDWWAAVWDDWRLIEWGYWSPDFGYPQPRPSTAQSRD